MAALMRHGFLPRRRWRRSTSPCPGASRRRLESLLALITDFNGTLRSSRRSKPARRATRAPPASPGSPASASSSPCSSSPRSARSPAPSARHLAAWWAHPGRFKLGRARPTRLHLASGLGPCALGPDPGESDTEAGQPPTRPRSSPCTSGCSTPGGRHREAFAVPFGEDAIAQAEGGHSS
jgi:hypothetical protein